MEYILVVDLVKDINVNVFVINLIKVSLASLAQIPHLFFMEGEDKINHGIYGVRNLFVQMLIIYFIKSDEP
jgi:hypothetical protein